LVNCMFKMQFLFDQFWELRHKFSVSTLLFREFLQIWVSMNNNTKILSVSCQFGCLHERVFVTDFEWN